jgi:hypothetical protein
LFTIGQNLIIKRGKVKWLIISMKEKTKKKY